MIKLGRSQALVLVILKEAIHKLAVHRFSKVDY
jgi:hypothetical protein